MVGGFAGQGRDGFVEVAVEVPFDVVDLGVGEDRAHLAEDVCEGGGVGQVDDLLHPGFLGAVAGG